MRCYKCMKEIGDSQFCPFCGYDLSSAPKSKQFLAPGTRLAGTNTVYTVGTVIGAGGFGVTYIGLDESLERRVAIKEYFPSALSTRIPGKTAISVFTGEKQQIFNHGKERFAEEARLLMRFTGEEGIVSVYDVFETNETVYMVMEYVEGFTLKQRFEQSGPIPEEELLNFMIPVLLSLKFVHNAGFAHRDISPDNIICQPDGTVKLVDFGSARYSVMSESRSLSVIVKQGFSPVEQYQSHGNQGPWTDIYAIGATMYAALTGGAVPDDSLERMANETLKKPSRLGAKVSENTENAIMAALNIRAEDRPQNIDEFLAILTGERSGGLIGGKPKKKKGVFIAALLAIIIGAAALVFGILRLSDGESAPNNDIEVPNAINKTDSAAEELFYEHQLKMEVTGGRLYDAEMIEQGYIAENLVVEQEPVGGTPAEANSTVGVVLSKGKEKEYVPSVTDKLLETAKKDFEKSGFGSDFEIEVEEKYSDTNMAGTIISQSLPEDAAVDFDGKIKLTVSLGREQSLDSISTVTVGNYIGADFDTLKAELLQSGVYLVKAASVYSVEYPYGAIISQSPSEGSEIKSGGAVYVITSLGIEMTYVPDVRYLTLDEAKAALMKNGLSWKIKYAVTPDVALGLVAEQKTAPGNKTPFGAEIELIVSAENDGEETKTVYELSISPESEKLPKNETKKFFCYMNGEAIGSCIWSSSNPRIAEVDANGSVTAKSFGSATISAALDGNVAVAVVTVTDYAVLTEIDELTLTEGETVSLSSEIADNIRDLVVWRSSFPAVASVDKNGTVTALGEGYTSISAVYGDQLVKCGITVIKKTEYIKIPRNVLLGKLKTAEQALISHELEYEVIDEYSDTVAEGNITKITYVGYTDNDSFYIVSGSKVTLQHSIGKNSVASVRVKTPPTKTAYYIGETPSYAGMVLTVTYRDGTVKDIDRGYSAPTTALNELGTQKLTVSYGGKSAQVAFTVNAVAVSSLDVTPSSVSLNVGDKQTLTVTVLPSSATDKNVTAVSSDSSVVRADGMTLTALKAGTATVTVKASNGKTASCKVTVLGNASLKIKTMPEKTEYYIGDKLDASGLTLSYTNRNGSTSTVNGSAASLRCDMSTAGTKTVTVGYDGLETSFTVKVKTPSIKLNKIFTEEGTIFVVTTDPEDVDVGWSSSDTRILRISGEKIVPVSTGTAYVRVTMTYNGIEYSDSLPVFVEVEEYSFKIVEVDKDLYGIDTDIPNFDLKNVNWSCTYPGGYEIWDTGELDVWEAKNSYIVTASYVYNGKTYTDTYTYTYNPTLYFYALEVKRSSDSINGERGYYYISTDIKNFDSSKVSWSLEITKGSGWGGWVSDNGTYTVDECGMDPGDSYTLYAEYTIDGVTEKGSYQFTYNP